MKLASTALATPALMQRVMIALLPGTLVMIWYFGWGVLFNILIAVFSCIVFESLALLLRRRAILPTLTDGSACLAGWLLALALPPLLPWWITVIGCTGAMLLGKHLYGGLGFNLFNPAMVGYAILLISFPRDMSAWLATDLGLSFADTLNYVWQGRALIENNWDAITRPTPLDHLWQSDSASSLQQAAGVNVAAWQWINLGFLAGGLYLLYKKIISWHIPVSLLLVLSLCYTVDWILFSGLTSPWSALLSGATMLAAFFIATDPVTAATSRNGRLVFAAGIGLLIFTIRRWGDYPDGVAFAVLIMNMAAPALDHYYKPRAFGQ